MNRLPLLALIAITACSHFKEEEKVVHFPYAPELLQTVQKGKARSPASVVIDAKEHKSTRRTYFSALYHQYLAMGNHLHEEPAISFCPQFHHDKIETEAFVTPKFNMYKVSSIQSEGKEYFPELAFNKRFSLRDHHAEMRRELETLCEDGVSDNFYKFDNLVTHHANRPAFHLNDKAMESVLKIPVFANYYLIKMMQQGQNLLHPEEKRVIELTQTTWFENYVSEAQKLRSSFIKNRMVKR